jgi:hypothetical protein
MAARFGRLAVAIARHGCRPLDLAANADHRHIMGARAPDRLPAAAQLDDLAS